MAECKRVMEERGDEVLPRTCPIHGIYGCPDPKAATIADSAPEKSSFPPKLKERIANAVRKICEGTAFEVQEGGSHYKSKPIQPAVYSAVNELTPDEANVVKYVTRHRDKGGLEDLKKAQHYLQMIIDMEYK
jgi:hypothetical protein